MSPFDTPDDPFYDGQPAWVAQGRRYPLGLDDWGTVETYRPRHRRVETMDPKYALAWEDDPELVADYAAHTPRHRAAL